jgi:hypothetical protein
MKDLPAGNGKSNFSISPNSRWRSRDEAHEEMVFGILERRDEPLPENPPPGPKWQAKQGLHCLDLNGAENRVMFCLIERANKFSGLCFPSEDWIAGWTRIPKRTVERAVASLKAKGLIGIVPVRRKRGGVSNRYYAKWEPLFAGYRHMKAFEAASTEKRNAARDAPSKVAGTPQSVPSKVAGRIPSKVAV